jgi:L-ribulose-5-phosphate 3-epimerase
MKLGIRAHDFGKHPVEVLSRKITDKGFTSIQLALAKAVSDINYTKGQISPGLANYIGEAFHKNNIQIAVLGCYINPVHPDLTERKNQIDRFKEHLRFARDFGCCIVATETGSMNADCSYHPENNSQKQFDMLITSVSELVNEAEKFGVLVCIEGVTTHTISNPELMLNVLDRIGSNNLQVLFDPVNLISVDNYKKQEDMIKQAFDLFGDRIQIIHAKDFNFKDNNIVSTYAGDGILNYEFLLKTIKQRKPFINILLEDTKEDKMEFSKKYIEDIYSKL